MSAIPDDRCRPVGSVPPGMWREVVGVATDLDDTLTAHGELSAKVVAALEDVRAMGLPCVVATGRSLGWGAVLARVLPVRAVVAENGGAYVRREEAGVRIAFMEPDEVRDAGMRRVAECVGAITDRFAALRVVSDGALRVTDVALDINERVSVDPAVVAAAVAMARDAGLHAVTSSIHMHVSYRAADKVAGLRAALGALGLDPAALDARWIYVGDSPNDAGAFGAMALSFGVAGVRRFAGSMPAWPRYATDEDGPFGFAAVVAALRAGRAA
ncbi:MAG: family hydrolase [Myxococcaceae bacterium]|nr:family hydrolase [Myxococcaceae bacterium]